MKIKKILFSSIIFTLFFDVVYADKFASCGDYIGIPYAIPSVIKTFVLVLKIFVPIFLLVFSSIEIIIFIISKNPDFDRLRKRIVPKFIAAVAIFFVVTIVQLLFKSMGNLPAQECINCFINDNNACEYYEKEMKKDYSDEVKKAAEEREKVLAKREEERLANEKKAREEWEKRGTLCHTSLDFTYKGDGSVKSNFSSETKKIVEKHYNDFNANNIKSYINSNYNGKFSEYAKSLGGVFADYYGEEVSVSNATEFQKVSEYVFGFLYMYGVDYFNGISFTDSGKKYCKWGGGCLYYKDYFAGNGSIPSGSSDAFYPGSFRYDNNGLSNKNNFDKMISDLNSPNITTNCNWTVDMVYYKAGLFGGEGQLKSSSNYETMIKKYGYFTDPALVKVGDIIHFFDNPIEGKDVSSWSSWKHVAYVGEVDSLNKTFTAYDGGSYFTNNRNYKWTASMEQKPSSLHGYSGYAFVHVVDLC